MTICPVLRVVAVHEGVFLGRPVISLELVGIVVTALLAQHALQRLARPAAIRQSGMAEPGAVHVFLDQPHPPLAVHRGQVHLAGFDRRQDDVRALADLGGHDVDIDREQAPGLDGRHDGVDHLLAGRARAGVHRFLHHVGAAVVDALELGGVQRRLVVVVRPDVVDLAVAADQEVVDVGRRAPDMGVGRAACSLPGARRGGTTPPPGRPMLPVASPIFTSAPIVR